VVKSKLGLGQILENPGWNGAICRKCSTHFREGIMEGRDKGPISWPLFDGR
jgi:hypothetical protein